MACCRQPQYPDNLITARSCIIQQTKSLPRKSHTMTFKSGGPEKRTFGNDLPLQLRSDPSNAHPPGPTAERSTKGAAGWSPLESMFPKIRPNGSPRRHSFSQGPPWVNWRYASEAERQAHGGAPAGRMGEDPLPGGRIKNNFQYLMWVFKYLIKLEEKSKMKKRSY